jgi:hypothetical protein
MSESDTIYASLFKMTVREGAGTDVMQVTGTEGKQGLDPLGWRRAYELETPTD